MCHQSHFVVILGANNDIGLKSLQKVRVIDLFSVLWIVGFRISTLPMKHLGLPLEAPYKSCRIWDGII